jgi:pimeloyl-ACP methyl ester carboxylesterase
MATPQKQTPNLPTHYLAHDGGTLAYTDYGGDSTPVLMLPGMGSLRATYRFLAPLIHAAGYRSIPADLRGQGDTSPRWPSYDVPSVGGDIIALIEHLDAGPAHVIANSYSPAPAIWAAVERPNLTKSLVLISTFITEQKPNIFMRALTHFMMNSPWRAQTWAMYYRGLYKTQTPPDFDEYVATMTRNLAEPGRFDAVKGFPAAPRQPWLERIPRLKVPVLAIMGSQDPDFPDPRAEGESLVSRTGGTLVMIEGAGHYPHAEMPAQTAAPIIEFLNTQ